MKPKKMRIEGVDYIIDWREFKKGTSVFFPCLDYARARAELMAVVNRLKAKVVIATVIEDGVRGLRVWRM